MRVSWKTMGALELTTLLRYLCLIMLCVVPLMLASVASAQDQQNQEGPAETKEDGKIPLVRWLCSSEQEIRSPTPDSSDPFRFSGSPLSCPEATRVLARIADCCIPGDRWRLTGAVVDHIYDY